VVYVHPKTTNHLTFPGGLLLLAGGYVEVGFIAERPGTIMVSLNGHLD